MQSGSGLSDPHKAPHLTPEAVAKLSPKEKEDRQVSGRATRLQQLEVQITEALLASQRDGIELEGQPKAIVPIHDIVVHVIGADDAFILPPEIRESLIEKGGQGSSVFMLRGREALATELYNFRLSPDADVELPGRNRDEKRAARKNLSRHPYREIAATLRKPPFEGCYYAVVHSMAGASVFPFRFDATEMQAGLDEEYAKKAAREAAAEKSVAAEPESGESPTE